MSKFMSVLEVLWFLLKNSKAIWQEYKSIGDWEDTVAGVEAVLIDGCLYYYGYSYSCDEVVSPIIGDAKSFAKMAATNLSQTDGKHNSKYWLGLVEDSKEESNLFGDVPQVSLERYSHICRLLKEVVNNNSVVTELPKCEFLEYIILELGREHIPEETWYPINSELKIMGIKPEELGTYQIEELMEYLRGESLEQYPNNEYRSAALIIQTYIEKKLEFQGETWAETFQDLVSSPDVIKRLL